MDAGESQFVRRPPSNRWLGNGGPHRGPAKRADTPHPEGNLMRPLLDQAFTTSDGHLAAKLNDPVRGQLEKLHWRLRVAKHPAK